jgi:hypothetical protein
MSNVVLVSLETVLVSVQDRCMVCDKRTIGSGIISDAPDRTQMMRHLIVLIDGHTRWYSWMTRLKWKLNLVKLGILLILTQDRCTVYAKRTIGSQIVLDAPDGTPR